MPHISQTRVQATACIPKAMPCPQSGAGSRAI